MKQDIHDEIPRDGKHRFLLWLEEYDDTQKWANRFESKVVQFMVDTDSHGKWTLYKHMPYGPSVCDCLQNRGIIDMAEDDLVGPSLAKKLAPVFA